MTFFQIQKYVSHGNNLFNFNLGSHNANNLMIKKNGNKYSCVPHYFNASILYILIICNFPIH